MITTAPLAFALILAAQSPSGDLTNQDERKRLTEYAERLAKQNELNRRKAIAEHDRNRAAEAEHARQLKAKIESLPEDTKRAAQEAAKEAAGVVGLLMIGGLVCSFMFLMLAIAAGVFLALTGHSLATILSNAIRGATPPPAPPPVP